MRQFLLPLLFKVTGCQARCDAKGKYFNFFQYRLWIKKNISIFAHRLKYKYYNYEAFNKCS